MVGKILSSGWRVGLSVLVFNGAWTDPVDAEAQNPRLSLAWNDPYQQIPWDTQSVFEQVESLLLDMGVEADWSGDSDDSSTTRVEVLVRPNRSEQLGLVENAMGAVIDRRGSGDHVFVFLPNVLRTLGHEDALGLSTSPKARSQINRALARVITHELIHAVLPERPHDEQGLFSTHLTRRVLLARKIEVDAHTSVAFALELNEH